MTETHRPLVEMTVEAGSWSDTNTLEALCRKAVAATCEIAELAMVPDTEMGILLSDDAHVQTLNGAHRGRDIATNVLSFPICDAAEAVKGPLLGDIVLAFETVQAEAKAQDKPLEEHFSHLIIHGFLHLFGYDHQIEQEAIEMEALEIDVMKHLGYSNPYAGTAI